MATIEINIDFSSYTKEEVRQMIQDRLVSKEEVERYYNTQRD